ncbi:acyltransferase family protein [Rhodopseudomonas boonkerdii]|uniref:acyltransferase family protein n=1 Tax=Rhodopseudomonas boonkerdii TaxID=475937 RepID=UPI001E2902A6|nr:acyltransferase [Rhodopseudomonas boonkerdii]
MTANKPVHPTAYLDLLRAVAIVLVVNSHLDSLYPIPQLGTGGVFGNELFFFISGYGLYLGYQASREAMGSWLKRRLTRVYEPLVIVATFLVLVGDAHIRTFSDFFFLYIIPLQFWFLPAIVACYVPIYVIMAKMETKRAYAYLFGGLALAYILLFAIFAQKTVWLTEDYSVQTEVTLPLRMIFYFGTMVMGVYAAKFHADIKGKLSDLLWLMVSIAGFYLFVGSLGRIMPFEVQIIDRIPALAFLVFAFRFARYQPLEQFIANHLSGLVTLLAATALQIYLLHDFVLRQEAMKAMSFPANLIVFGLATLLLAILFEKISFKPQAKARPVKQAAATLEAKGANSNSNAGQRRAS